MKVNHIGYAVRSLDKARDDFERLGFVFESPIEDKDRNVIIAFGNKDGYRIELISPLIKDKQSPVDNYLSKSFGTPYHFCYSSSSFEEDIENLIQKGFKVILKPMPAIAFSGRQVVFLISQYFGLMEIVEE